MNIQDFIWSYDLKKLDLINFKNIKEDHRSEYHELGQKTHGLLSYHLILHNFYVDNDSNKEPLGQVFLDWNYCPDCQKVRNKRLVGLDYSSRIAYMREIVRHGEIYLEPEDNSELVEQAKLIFSSPI